jgi:ribosome biogenesis GTPase
LEKGVVVKTTGSWHYVKSYNDLIQCKLKGNFRIREIKNTNPVAVGDYVNYERSGNNTGIITKIYNRKNYIIRKATKLSHEAHILAANVDQVFLMITLDFPETPLEFVDRFLISCEAYHIKCILLINKIDLYNEEKLNWLNTVKKMYGFAGYQVIEISVKQNKNTKNLPELFNNKLSLLAGNSGVGKSSLINLFCPGLNLKTNDVSSHHLTGKHTTAFPEMFELPSGGFIIDSPGIRGFGVVDLDKNEIGLYFTDIFRLSRHCQFYNCTHQHEPNCAVIEAFNKGILHGSRYRSYINIITDNNKKYRMT